MPSPVITCQQCGKTFNDSPANKRKYCSQDCYHKAKRNRIALTCEYCGKPFETIQAEIEKAHSRNSEVRYCSRACWRSANVGKDNPAWQGGDQIIECDNCHNQFARPRTWYKPGTYKFQFCTHECKVKYWRARPEETPNWKGDATKRERELRKHYTYIQWRKAVYERDNYKCRKCGNRGGRLNAHHLYDFSKYPELRLNLDNGHTLCKSCHLAVKGHERDYRISLGLPADNPPFRLELFPAWDT